MSSPSTRREEHRPTGDEPSPEEIRGVADLVREGGFEDLADWFEAQAEDREEVADDAARN